MTSSRKTQTRLSKAKALAKVMLCLALAPTMGGAETLFKAAPWIVESGYGLDDQPVCTISGLTPFSGLSITASSSQDVYVQAFETGATHPAQDRILIIQLPGDDAFVWDAVWLREIAVSELDLRDEHERGLYAKLADSFENGGAFTFYPARAGMPYADWVALQVNVSLSSGAEALTAFEACVSDLVNN